MPSVSVVVPIFNGTAFLPSFFASLAEAIPDHAQIVLVNDASTEPVWETVPPFPRASAIVRLSNAHNSGYSASVNRGFTAATGDVVVQLNTDLVLEPDCIGAMIRLIESERRVGIVGSKLVYPTTGRVQHLGKAIGNHTKRRFFADLPVTHPLCGRTRELQIVSGATVAMTRKVLDLVGPLNEDYFNRNEDIEHCLAARQLGLRNFACADSVAHHWKHLSGPARFARADMSEALFWSRWGSRCKTDLDRFVDEGLDHLLTDYPDLESVPFEILDLTRSADQAIVLERLAARWPGITERVRNVRQMNNPSATLSLSLLLPHWTALEPVPFIYLTDSHRELEENVLWFRMRKTVVREELVVDLNAVALPTSQLGFS